MEFYEPTAHTDEEIRSAIADNSKTILFLQTSWCGDCKVIKPFVGSFRNVAEAQGAVWVDADRDENIEFANENNLRGIPVFVLFENGEQVAHIGNGQRLNPNDVTAWFKENL